MAVIERKLRVTHLVDQDAALGAWGQAGLNEDLMA
jgi:hypothetical protein